MDWESGSGGKREKVEERDKEETGDVRVRETCRREREEERKRDGEEKEKEKEGLRK